MTDSEEYRNMGRRLWSTRP